MNFKKALLSGVLATQLIIPSVFAQSKMDCTTGAMAEPVEYVKQRSRIAKNRITALNEMIAEQKKHLKGAKTVAYTSTVLGAASVATLYYAAAAPLLIAKVNAAFFAGGTSGASQLIGVFFAVFTAPVWVPITGAAYSGGLVLAGTTSALVRSIASGDIAKFREEAEKMGEVEFNEAISNILNANIRSTYEQNFSNQHDNISFAAANATKKIGERWYALGWDDLRFVQVQLEEAEAHKRLYEAEIKFSNSISSVFSQLCE